ncbi:MAG: hypothetical protein HQ515_10895 [Phycisphaeraceae bacterium]|nr:hypothetical protein [Phycisphaeraceae bacterium]
MQLQKELEDLKADQDQQRQIQEKEALQKALQAQLAVPEESHTPEAQTQTSGGLSLSQLNPEISFSGNFVYDWQQGSPDQKTMDFNFRELGIHVQSWLDPYTKFKAAIPVTETETTLEEGYIELHQIADNVILTLGKFRQQFGMVNRWHGHALDQVNFPVALRRIFGDEGLNQSGASLDWLMPAWGPTSQKLTFQLTDGENDRLFFGNQNNRPSLLGRYSLFRDVSEDTYWEAGLSGLLGWNDTWAINGADDQMDSKETAVLGVDFSTLWEPTDRMRYRNVQWRSELYWLHHNILAPDGSGADTLHAWGMFSYVQAKVSRTIDIGLRGDLFVPDTKNYANLSSTLSLSPLAVTSNNPYLYQCSPYITWSQSPFVHFRGEYDYSDGKGLSFARHVVWLQAVFAAGPHKHERY